MREGRGKCIGLGRSYGMWDWWIWGWWGCGKGEGRRDFVWSNIREGDMCTWVRLLRGLANVAWKQLFSNTSISVLYVSYKRS